MTPHLRRVETEVLSLAFEEWGNADAPVVILLHGFPYDPRAFDAVAPALAAQGKRVIVPYLRGFGPTRFLSGDTFRSGEQAAIACDVRQLMDALHIRSAILAGFDWGGRAAGIVAALWPERVRGLVAIGGYLIQNIAKARTPQPPASEQAAWHQYYLSSERGRNALQDKSRDLARHLWRSWSPKWEFAEEEFERTARSFDNPDFVNVVAHSYRHRIGAAIGDERYAAIEMRLGGSPLILVPSMIVRGSDAPLRGGGAAMFSNLIDERVAEGAGHNPAQETPTVVIDAVLDLVRHLRNAAAS